MNFELYNQTGKEYISVNKSGRYRIGLVDPFIATNIPENTQTVVDIGCGNANYWQTIRSIRPSVTRMIGIENSAEMLKQIPTEVVNNPANVFIQENFLQATHLNTKSDTAIVVYAIEHCHNSGELNQMFDNIKQVLRPNGTLLILTNDSNALITSKAYGNAIKYEILGNAPFTDGQQFRVKVKNWETVDTYWQPATVCQILEAKGFETFIVHITKETINQQLYQEDEIAAIIDSKAVLIIKATLKQ